MSGRVVAALVAHSMAKPVLKEPMDQQIPAIHVRQGAEF
jgi:hypothetical protein